MDDQAKQMNHYSHEIDWDALPTRAVRLKRLGVKTVGDLIQLTESDILKVEYIGKKTLKEIKCFLEYEYRMSLNTPSVKGSPLGDRYIRAHLMRAQGNTYKAIGLNLNVSATRAYQMVNKSKRVLRRQAWLIERERKIENEHIKIIKIFRDTPVASPGGKVTIICEKSEYPKPTIATIKRRLLEIGFCDANAIFDIQIVN